MILKVILMMMEHITVNTEPQQEEMENQEKVL
jgi:hypothetical protein